MNFFFSAGGQFEPVRGGQFEPVYPVQLKSESGGQHNRFLQFILKNMVLLKDKSITTCGKTIRAI